MKPILPHFSITFKGDGSTKSVAFTLTTAPLIFGNPKMATAFSLTATAPTAVTNVTSSDSQSVSASLLAGVCTVTWPIAVPANSLVTVYGNLEF